MPQPRKVRITRSCAGAERAVTSAVRIGCRSRGSLSGYAGRKKVLEWAAAEWRSCSLLLGLAECVKPCSLITRARLVGEQHRVAVKRDAQSSMWAELSEARSPACGTMVAAACPDSSACRHPRVGRKKEMR